MRISNGRSVMLNKGDSRGYIYVSVGGPRHLLHRIKFGLKHGYLPDSVDHKDRSTRTNTNDNLRAASGSLQKFNRVLKRSSGLRRGVRKHKNGPNYYALITVNRKVRYLGTFQDPEAASDAYEAAAREIYGDQYTEAPE